MTAGDRQGAIQQFREARWQCDHEVVRNFQGDVAAQAVAGKLQRDVSLSLVASQVLNTPKLRYCARHGYWS